MKRINLAMSLLVAFWMGACGSVDAPSGGSGGVTFDLVWQEGGPVLAASDSRLFAFSPSRFYPQSLPLEVVSLKAIITGPDMDRLEQTFTGLYPSGGTIVIRTVPEGINRSLVLEGRNAADAIIYQGTISGFTVVALETNDIGQIVMYPYGEGIVADPSNLAGQAVSSARVALSWTDNADNETGFYLERMGADELFYSQIGSVARDVTGYEDDGLSCGIFYMYRLFAYGAVDSSDYSNIASIFVPCLDTVITLAPPPATQSPAPVFGFSCNFTSCSFECDLDGGGYSICASPRSYSGLADGQHLFSVRSVDISGRVDASPALYSWKVDRVPPDTTITQSPTSPSDSTVAFEFACDEGNCLFECQIDGGAFAPCGLPAVYKLEDGTHDFSVRAADPAGNVDATPASFNWLVIGRPQGLPGEEAAPAPVGSWQKTRSRTVPAGRYAHTTVWTGTEMIVWGGTTDGNSLLNDGSSYNPSTDTWTPLSSGLTPRTYHTVVWTGTEMIIWGGLYVEAVLGDGARYNPATDSWTPTRSPASLPEARQYATVIWTGTEAIAWGGYESYYGSYLNSGARYDPATDTWTPTDDMSANTPSGRMYHTAVWTGTEMIVWGGYNGSYLMDGGRYNPSSDSWTPTAIDANTPAGRDLHTAVWTGSEMIVWGGQDVTGFSLRSGGRYDPNTDTWTPTLQDGSEPSERSWHTAVWDDSDGLMIVWGGSYYDGSMVFPLNSGGRYDPASDTWTPTFNSAGVPPGREAHSAVWTGSEMIVWGGGDPFSGTYLNTGGRYTPSTDSWTATDDAGADVPTGRNHHFVVWTEAEMIVWGGNDSGGLTNTGSRYNPGDNTWTAITIDPATPSPRMAGVAVWTGNAMLVWSGYEGFLDSNTGAAYVPALDSWFTSGGGPFVETPRYGHTAVWTGTEMIVWGGNDEGYNYSNTGARYNPKTDTWTPTSIDGDLPSAREQHQAVWTGTEMVVWGGQGESGYLDTGGRYDPGTDSWRATYAPQIPSARNRATAVWTGTEMIVWGGYSNYSYTNTGARYSPVTDSWITTDNGANVPEARQQHTAVWTGTEMIVWGGYDYGNPLNNGGRYNPALDSWMPTSTGANAPSARYDHTAVWTGSEMVIWGGNYHYGLTNEGARYNPSDDSWMAMTTTDAPSARKNHAAVWTDRGMVVWGGTNGELPIDGGIYNPGLDTWTPTAIDANTPSGRMRLTAVWTGTEMIVWGGSDGGYLNTGGRYRPSTDSWSPTSTGTSVPSGREAHTAVWTGTEMIVWGGTYHNGVNGMEPLNDGGRYNPSSDTWTPTGLDENTPSAREQHTAVWADTEMIIWGGYDNYYSSYFNTGARYDPDTDAWTPTGNGGVPYGRSDFTAVWTGNEMIVWGGNSSRGYINNGGRYNPWTDTWKPTGTDENIPSPRGYHSAVWTGNEMIVWGGSTRGDISFFYNDGSRYSPGSDSWTPVNVENAPIGRDTHTAVWTGTEMIVWGGIDQDYYSRNDGGRYNPGTDSWTPTDIGANIPTGRAYHTAVWTGSEMIVWGGMGMDYSYFNDGGRYDPATDSWLPFYCDSAPSGRQKHTAIWTGTEMIVWGGGQNLDGWFLFNDGGRYNPSLDEWTSIDPGATNTPGPRIGHTAVWTGTKMIVWGGYDDLAYTWFNDGGLYDPATDTWTPTDNLSANTPEGRADHTAVWDDAHEAMIVWGGDYHFGVLGDGAVYRPAEDSWTPVTAENAPGGRYFHTAVWTGNEMVVWGGSDGMEIRGDGGKYNPADDSWKAVSSRFAPGPRYGHTAVCALGVMVVWGGTDENGYYRDGGVYDPSGDYWVGTVLSGAPDVRSGHTAVWTGTEMIIWGGYSYYLGMGTDGFMDTGGRFRFQKGDTSAEASEIPYIDMGGGGFVN